MSRYLFFILKFFICMILFNLNNSLKFEVIIKFINNFLPNDQYKSLNTNAEIVFTFLKNKLNYLSFYK